MIIVTDTTGLWGNQLWAYANIIALAKECKTKAVIIIKRDFYDSLDIKRLNADKNIRIYPEGSFTARRIRWLTGFLRYRTQKEGLLKKILNKMPLTVHEEFIDEKDFKKQLKKPHFYFMNSWEQILNKDFFYIHGEEIRKAVMPNTEIITAAAKTESELKSRYDLIVGVHMRKGEDYKTWHGGKYYYGNEVYAAGMKRMQELNPDKIILFRAFSDKPVDTAAFPGMNVYFADHQNPLSDLWAMGTCDYLFGPLSTFSMWASFWNKVPLLYITADNINFNSDSFKVIAAQDIFEGGQPVC